MNLKRSFVSLPTHQYEAYLFLLGQSKFIQCNNQSIRVVIDPSRLLLQKFGSLHAASNLRTRLKEKGLISRLPAKFRTPSHVRHARVWLIETIPGGLIEIRRGKPEKELPVILEKLPPKNGVVNRDTILDACEDVIRDLPNSPAKRKAQAIFKRASSLLQDESIRQDSKIIHQKLTPILTALKILALEGKGEFPVSIKIVIAALCRFAGLRKT